MGSPMGQKMRAALNGHRHSSTHSGNPAARVRLALLCLFSSLFFVLLSLPSHAQIPPSQQARYEDAYTFIRVHWEAEIPLYAIRFFSGRQPPWSHDYPTAEHNLYNAIKMTTNLRVSGDPKILTLDDDQIFDFPILYICEVGFWKLSDDQAQRLAEYLNRGGFMIVDDFRGTPEYQNLLAQFRKAIPRYTVREMTAAHPIFHCYFEFDALSNDSPYNQMGFLPKFYGVFDQNGRLAVIINYNNDIGDGWEWPKLDEVYSTEAFRLGINYLIYSMTH